MADRPQGLSDAEPPEACHEVTAPRADFGRRRFLLGAAAAGTAAWAVPAIVTMEPAGAAGLTSPPPTPPEVEVLPKTIIDPPVDPSDPVVEVAGAPAANPEVEVRGALAVTGAPIDTLLGAGAAAIAGGGALHQWSARAARRSAASTDAPAVPGAAEVPNPPAG